MEFLPLVIWAVGFLYVIKEPDESWEDRPEKVKEEILIAMAPVYIIGLAVFLSLGFICLAVKN